MLLRSRDRLAQLCSANPFKEIEVTSGVRFYVTFLAPSARKPVRRTPCAKAAEEFRIVGATATEVFSVVDLEKGMGTPEAMVILEKEFGSGLTTRNWNTILKVLG